MEASEVNRLLEGQTVLAGKEDGLEIHYVFPQEERDDTEKGFRVFSIGQPADKPTKCVLLLGETGAGKTTVINAAINYLFGVRFEDSFRLRVKEEIPENRMETESQTDHITVYRIYYKEGMKHEYNFVFIDTPGQADTRGAQHQQDIECRIEAFLTSDFQVDVNQGCYVNCVGLVAKANTNRYFDSQKAVLGEIISLLGDTVPDITHIFATFAADKPTVDTVMRNAGVSFQSVFQFDNGVLFSSQMDNAKVPLRWDDMSKQYETFIKALIKAPPVSVQLRKLKEHFDASKKNLKTHIEKLATSLLALENDKKILMKYELQEAKNKDWMQEETVEKQTIVPLEDGIHAHNCYSCQKTCIFPCYKSTGSNLQAGLAGGASGTAAGAAVSSLTTSTIASAASSTGFAASIGNMAASTFGGAITVAEVGAVGLAAPVAVGAVVGVGLGLFTKAMYNKMTNSCGVVDIDSVCGKDGCKHSLSDHSKEDKIIVKESEVQKKTDEKMKELYDEAIEKKLEVNDKIVLGLKKILSCIRSISLATVELLCHAKKIQELTLQDFSYIEDKTCQLINEIRLGEPSIIPCAVKSVSILKEAMRRLVSCTTEEILGKHGFVEEMLRSSFETNDKYVDTAA